MTKSMPPTPTAPPNRGVGLKSLKKRLSREDLRQRIQRFLDENCVLTLATFSRDQPRSTPLRYRHCDFKVYSFTEGGGKIINIRRNPKVAISIYGPYTGFQSVACLQAWGLADIVYPEDTQRYQAVRGQLNLNDRDDLKQLGIQRIPDMKIIRIDLQRARFLSLPEGLGYHGLDLTEAGP
jgi:hypothetical protein